MKVSIVTQPLMENYGGILQNYALQQTLRQLGHEPVTIDWLPVTGLRWYLRGIARTIIKGIPYRRLFYLRPELFDSFVRKNINTTRPVRRYRRSLLKGTGALLAGSDQVWRPGYSLRTLPDMFFRFAGDFKGIRIAYAASFGIDSWEVPAGIRKECIRYAKSINPVSVREKSGIAICKEQLGIDAVQMPDPVLLLPAEAYLDLCSGIPKAKTPYIAAYILDEDKNSDEMLDKLASRTGFAVRRCTAGRNATLSVEEWLALFRDAQEVVTDSYHGTIIAGLFEKKCTTLSNTRRGSTRFDELNREPMDYAALSRKGRDYLREALR